jgi:hypothetical protein
MKNSPRMSFRLPPAVLRELDRRATAAGVTPSRYMVRVLIDHLGVEAEPLTYTFQRSARLAKKASKKGAAARKVPAA